MDYPVYMRYDYRNGEYLIARFDKIDYAEVVESNWEDYPVGYTSSYWNPDKNSWVKCNYTPFKPFMLDDSLFEVE